MIDWIRSIIKKYRKCKHPDRYWRDPVRFTGDITGYRCARCNTLFTVKRTIGPIDQEEKK